MRFIAEIVSSIGRIGKTAYETKYVTDDRVFGIVLAHCNSLFHR
jgi:hypothetical protein